MAPRIEKEIGFHTLVSDFWFMRLPNQRLHPIALRARESAVTLALRLVSQRVNWEKPMTHAEQILRAVAAFVQRGKTVFTRDEIRREIGISREEWDSGYTAIFQGMRSDHPGGAPKVREKYRRVFRKIQRGRHALTNYGRQLIQEFVVFLSEPDSVPLVVGSGTKTVTLYSANKPNRTLTVHKRSCSRIPKNQLDECGCGSTGQLGNQHWWCGEHITIQAVNEFMNQRLWAILLCHICFE